MLEYRKGRWNASSECLLSITLFRIQDCVTKTVTVTEFYIVYL